jgi:hypothetical protein
VERTHELVGGPKWSSSFWSFLFIANEK